MEEADRTAETVLVHTLTWTRLLCGAGNGAYSGDRRPEMYGILMTHGEG